jgi:hypothetical protein
MASVVVSNRIGLYSTASRFDGRDPAQKIKCDDSAGRMLYLDAAEPHGLQHFVHCIAVHRPGLHLGSLGWRQTGKLRLLQRSRYLCKCDRRAHKGRHERGHR